MTGGDGVAVEHRARPVTGDLTEIDCTAAQTGLRASKAAGRWHPEERALGRLLPPRPRRSNNREGDDHGGVCSQAGASPVEPVPRAALPGGPRHVARRDAHVRPSPGAGPRGRVDWGVQWIAANEPMLVLDSGRASCPVGLTRVPLDQYQTLLQRENRCDRCRVRRPTVALIDASVIRIPDQ
jgi:hypothetical protein